MCETRVSVFDDVVACAGVDAWNLMYLVSERATGLRSSLSL